MEGKRKIVKIEEKNYDRYISYEEKFKTIEEKIKSMYILLLNNENKKNNSIGKYSFHAKNIICEGDKITCEFIYRRFFSKKTFKFSSDNPLDENIKFEETIKLKKIIMLDLQ
jgi:hypothetical protein